MSGWYSAEPVKLILPQTCLCGGMRPRRSLLKWAVRKRKRYFLADQRVCFVSPKERAEMEAADAEWAQE